ncbi:MAG: hypothetical protein IKF52_06060 [Clostridia bacterium]|nr:hypothetical protein [Clostridia bacterium]
MGRKLFSKFRDYNYILDQLLERKHFQENSKNLLLSMFYKIETSYDDYAKIKMINSSKNSFLDEVIGTIDEYCNYIYLLDPKKEEIQELKRKHTWALTDEREKKIYSYPTEVALLYGISDIKPKYFFIHNKYDYIKDVFQKVLVDGSNLNKTEVIRNFNGWSWDVDGDKNINCLNNLIYQELAIIFGSAFLKRWEGDSSPKKDYIAELKKRLKDGYDEKIMHSFYTSLLRLLLVISDDREKYADNYKKLLKSYKNISNKTEYILNISKEKIKINKSLEQIEKILNNQELLKREYNRRNMIRSDDKKYFSLEGLVNDLSREKELREHRYKQLTELSKPSSYLALKEDLKEKINIMSIFEKESIDVLEYVKAFQKEFIKCIDKEIEEITERDEYIELLYKLRYCKKLRVNGDIKIEDIKGLNNLIEKLMKKIVTKACENKFFNVFARNVDLNYFIISKVIDSQIINFETIDISLIKEKVDDKEVTSILIYDNDVLEKKEPIDFEFSKKDLTVRFKKQVSLYVL